MPAQKKKMLILAILGILRDGTDADHRIRQAEIMERLERDYALTATRKSVRKNLGDLQDAGYPVVFSKGWYYDPVLKRDELDLLTACVACSTLPEAKRVSILSRLTQLGGPYYRNTPSFGGTNLVNPQAVVTLDLAAEAIAEEKQFSFRYGDAGLDKELHPRLDETGKPIQFKVNPYRVECIGGRFYLICSMDRGECLTSFRINRILDARILKADSRPIERIADTADPLEKERRLQPAAGAAEAPVRTRLTVERGQLTDLLDQFGANIEIERATDTEVTATLSASPAEVDAWLRQKGGTAQRA